MEDYYEVLNVKPDASEKDIKKSFRNKAKECHPDKCKGTQNDDRFKKINEAYSVIGNPENRKHYDEYLIIKKRGFPGSFQDYKTYLDQGGQPFNSAQAGGGFNFGQGGAGPHFTYQNAGQEGFFNIEDILGGDIFSNLFGAAAQGKGGGRQHLQTFKMDIPFLMSAKGGDINFNLPEPFNQDVHLKVPAGIKDGSKIRLKNKGLEQVQLEIIATPHPLFRRDGHDIRSTIYIDVFTALLGGKQSVQTIWGAANMTIPEGTEPGTVLRLGGMGIKVEGKKPGNHLAEVQVRFPKNLTEEQKELLRKAEKAV
jgi:DnaJ-class molecular chaperone